MSCLSLKPRLHDTTCSRVNVCIHDTRCQTSCQTGLTTGLTNGCIVYTAGCQTGCTTRFDNRLNEQWLLVQHGCSTGWMFVYTIQPVVSCKWGISRSSNNINSSSTLSQKNVPPLTCYNHDTHGSITIILGPNVTEKAGNQNALNFPTSPH